VRIEVGNVAGNEDVVEVGIDLSFSLKKGSKSYFIGGTIVPPIK
jgi:hypothetical protein